MQAYEVRFLQEALEDVEEIMLYIARDSRAAALRMHDNIMKRVEDLAVFPKRGQPIPDKKWRRRGIVCWGFGLISRFTAWWGGKS